MIKFIMKILFYLPVRILYPTKVVGRKNLKGIKGATILTCNHFTNMDGIILTEVFFSLNFKYLSKIEMSQKRFSKWFFTQLGSIFIDRGKADLRAIREVVGHLKDGGRIMIFPEGTRNKSDSEDMKEMKGGVVYFASKTDAYIVPMQFEHRAKLLRMTRIIVGKPYKITDTSKAGSEREMQILEEKFHELRNELKKKKQ